MHIRLSDQLNCGGGLALQDSYGDDFGKPRHLLGLVVPAFDQGGGVPVVARFLRKVALSSGSYDVRVLSLATARDDVASLRLSNLTYAGHYPRAVARSDDGVDFEHIGATLPEFEFQRYRPRAALTEALQPCDLIQVVCGSPAWANSVLDSGRPVAVQVATRARVERRQRDALPRGLADWWRKGMTMITDQMDSRALRRVNAIQVENLWMLEYVREIAGGLTVDIRFAPPGVDSRWFLPCAGLDRMMDRYILCVARLSDPRKNITLLLHAYARLPDGLKSEVPLILAGSSEPQPAFWALVETLGLRERVSYVANPDAEGLKRLYQGASVFVLPSDEEGFGMVIVEAMACGVPVISTRSGGPDGIITDGVDGFLIPLGAVEVLAGRLAQLLRSPQENWAMGNAARATVERRFDERIAGEAFLDVWARLVRSGVIA